MSLTFVHCNHTVALDLFIFSCSIRCLHWSIHVLIIAHSVLAHLSILIISLSVKTSSRRRQLVKAKEYTFSITDQQIEFTSSPQWHTAWVRVYQDSSIGKHISIFFAVQKDCEWSVPSKGSLGVSLQSWPYIHVESCHTAEKVRK